MAKTEIITRTYEGHEVIYNSDGWINATLEANKHGKRIDHWLENKETQEYIAVLMEDLDTPISGYVKTSKARVDRGGGTWLHPKLAVFFARWLDVRFSVWSDKQIDSILRGTDDKKKLRHISIVSFKGMSTMLHDVRLIDNKDTKSHHYANEAKLVNWALCGEFKSLDREVMSMEELDLIAFLEVKNMVLIGRGLTYDQRKPMIKQYAMDWRMEHTPLIG